MSSVFIMHPGKAHYPELAAYEAFLTARGVKVTTGTLNEYRALGNKAARVVWAIMGFYPVPIRAEFVIHDYRSLSVGGWPAMKDLIKRLCNSKPHLRIFQNPRQQQIMGFRDGVPEILLPMGIPGWIFGLQQQRAAAAGTGADFCYIGVMSYERGFAHVLDAFLKRYRGTDTSFLLIGKPEPRLYAKYAHASGLTFIGARPQREALSRVLDCEMAVCYFPYHRPHCYQTPTKLLEYAALGRKIVCNDAPSNIASCKELNIRSVVTGPHIFDSLTDAERDAARPNSPDAFSRLSWDKVIEDSRVVDFLPHELGLRKAAASYA